MAYYGNAPADVALVVGQDVITTTEIQDSTIATADIANDAITALKIDDDGTGFQMGSLGLGTAVSGSEKLTVSGTASFADNLTVDKSISAGDLNTAPIVTFKNSQGSGHYTAIKFEGADSNGANTGFLGYMSHNTSATRRFVFSHDGTTRDLAINGDSSATFAGAVTAGHNSKITSSSADTTFKIETTSGTTIFPVLDFVSSHSSVGAKIRQDGSDVITIDNDQDVTFADDVTISGNTFMNGTYLSINDVGWIRHGSNELRLQTGTGGLNVMNNAYNTSLFSITNAGTATFAGNVTTDGIFKVDSAPDNDVIKFDQNGRKSAIKTYFSSASTGSKVIVKVSDGNTNGGMVEALDIRPSQIQAPFGSTARFAGNWEVIDVISCGSNVSHLSSNSCFNDQTYSHFKIIIPHYRPATNATDILFSLLYDTGSGLTEQLGNYYGHKQSMAHTTSGYLGGAYDNANRMTIFSGASNSTHAPTHGEITVFNANTADTRNFDTSKFTGHDYAGDGDSGSTFRPIGYFDMVGYNDTSDYYARDTGMFRQNTSRHASYWKGFRIQASSGNIASNTRIIVLGCVL